MTKLVIVLGLAALLMSLLLSSFLSLEYPLGTYVDLKSRLRDIAFSYSYSVVSIFDFLGIIRKPLFFRRFFSNFHTSALPNEGAESMKIANVPVTIFKPKAASKKLLPGIIYVPGGSFILPANEEHYQFCEMLSKNVTATVFMIQPPVAPESPYPAALESVRSVVEHLLRHAEDFGVRPGRIAVGGDDVGANLATSVAIDLANTDPSAAHAPPHNIYALYLVSPVLQAANLALPSYVMSNKYYRGVQPSEALSYYAGVDRPSSKLLRAINNNLHIPFTMKIRFQPLLDFNLMNESFIPDDYVAPDLALDLSPDVPERVTWLASQPEAFPLLFENSYLTKLPMTYIQVCEYSPSRDDGLIFAKRLEKNSGSLKLAVIRQALHDDTVLRSNVFTEASRDLVRFLRKHLYKV